MNNKLLLFLIGISLVLALAGAIGSTFFHAEFDLMTDWGLSSFVFLSTYLLLKNGKFVKTKEFRFVRLSISVLIMGALFKIMHWPLAGLILALGFLSVIILYLIYMLKKNKIVLTDWLKLMFVTTFLLGRYFKVIHFSYSYSLTIASIVILIFILARYVQDNGYLMSKR